VIAEKKLGKAALPFTHSSLSEVLSLGLFLDAILLFLSAITMDNGVLFWICRSVVGGHCAGILIILLRRKECLTMLDKVFILLGSFLIIATSFSGCYILALIYSSH
jgi:hypothetical protein